MLSGKVWAILEYMLMSYSIAAAVINAILLVSIVIAVTGPKKQSNFVWSYILCLKSRSLENHVRHFYVACMSDTCHAKKDVFRVLCFYIALNAIFKMC